MCKAQGSQQIMNLSSFAFAFAISLKVVAGEHDWLAYDMFYFSSYVYLIPMQKNLLYFLPASVNGGRECGS